MTATHEGSITPGTGWTCSCGWTPRSGVENTWRAFQAHRSHVRSARRRGRAQARRDESVARFRDEAIADLTAPHNLPTHAPTENR